MSRFASLHVPGWVLSKPKVRESLPRLLTSRPTRNVGITGCAVLMYYLKDVLVDRPAYTREALRDGA